jgi:hypothetical protein
MADLQVFKLEDTYVIKKGRGSRYFVTTADSFIIPTFNFLAIIKFMLYRGLLDAKALEGLLSEFREE